MEKDGKEARKQETEENAKKKQKEDKEREQLYKALRKVLTIKESKKRKWIK